MTEETKAGEPASKAAPSKATPPKKTGASESREERLASALRANLKRRKTQSRGRRSDSSGEGSAGT